MARTVPQLKDVAREADVSLATASIILRNGKGRFHEDTKRRVIECAQKLGWRQNLLVQSMQTGKTQTIGVLIPPFDSYWTNVVAGIHQELTDGGYTPITLWVSDEQGGFAVEEGGLAQIHKLVDRRVEAMIIWPDFAEAFCDEFVDLIRKNVPVLVIDHELGDKKIADSVQTDEEHGSRLAAEHLVNLGHRKIVCFGEYQRNSRSWQIKRRRYFEFALQGCDVDYQGWNLSEGDEDGFDMAYQMLSGPDRPTAVFAETDHLAVDIYNAAMALGIKIPQQLSVLGFANLSFSKSMRPPLTTISQQPIEIGKHAARLIVDRIEESDKQILPHTVRVSCELIKRRSTAVVPEKT